MADEDPQYLEWIRKQPCICCESPAPSHPHHHTRGLQTECAGCGVVHTLTKDGKQGGRGKGTRAHDHDAMPMCFKCHRNLHDLAGRFRGFTKERLREWQDGRVADLQDSYFSLDMF